jgi:hypothetical protein
MTPRATGRVPERAPPRAARRVRALAAIAVLVAAAVPLAVRAEFHCDRSAQYNATWCESSVITSVDPVAASAICREFTKRLTAECKPTWDVFRSCDEFARRFEAILVKACLAKGVAKRSCVNWGQAFAVSPKGRCENGRYTY